MVYKKWFFGGAFLAFFFLLSPSPVGATPGSPCGAVGVCRTNNCNVSAGETINFAGGSACDISEVCCDPGSGSGGSGSGGSGSGSGGSGSGGGGSGSGGGVVVSPCPAGAPAIAGICVPTSASTGGLSDRPVAEIIKNFMFWLLGIFGFLAIIGFVISGMQYLLSAGDEGMAETAKRNMTYCIIGIVVALSGFLVIRAIDGLLKGNAFF
ncbi:MAG: pilin [Candidatus Moraniibacteriota bacterium]